MLHTTSDAAAYNVTKRLSAFNEMSKLRCVEEKPILQRKRVKEGETNPAEAAICPETILPYAMWWRG